MSSLQPEMILGLLIGLLSLAVLTLWFTLWQLVTNLTKLQGLVLAALKLNSSIQEMGLYPTGRAEVPVALVAPACRPHTSPQSAPLDLRGDREADLALSLADKLADTTFPMQQRQRNRFDL